MVKDVDMIGVQMDLGASKRGVAMGPMAIRYGGLREGLEKLGHVVHDRGDIVPMETGESRPDLRYYQQVVDVNRRLYEQVTASLEQGHFPVTLGGDHSIAAGSIAAVAKHYEKKGGIGVIWIDAHGDWNHRQYARYALFRRVRSRPGLHGGLWPGAGLCRCAALRSDRRSGY